MQLEYHRAGSWSMKWIKFFLFMTNVMFVFIGVLVISTGAAVKSVYSDFTAFVDEQFYSPACMFIIVGVITVSIALFGFIGTIRESSLLINIYCGLLSVVFLLEVTATFVGVQHRHEVGGILKQSLNSSLQRYPWNSHMQRSVDFMQLELECCGVNSYQDWEDVFAVTKMSGQPTLYGIQSTAGAIPVRNPKGELSMQKVKVHRYVSGKRPEYAQHSSSEEESDEDDFIDNRRTVEESYRESRRREESDEEEDALPGDVDDPRIRRLQAIRAAEAEEIERERRERHRFIHEPELVQSEEEEEEEAVEMEEEEPGQHLRHRRRPEQSDEDEAEEDEEEAGEGLARTRRISIGSESESDTELSDSEIERRRNMLRQKMMQQKKEEEVLQKEDEGQSDTSESESSEYEETESEEENEPRLKPLFVRKKDRTTVIEKEREANKQKQLEYESKKAAKERRRQTLKLVEDSIKKDMEKAKVDNEPNLNDVNTDDENDEVEYEAWKLRELKRIKRDREEKEGLDKEKMEIERIRNMTEEERRQDQRLNPKLVTNKTVKGKYKFLQKYYHRGAFYLDEEDQVYKQDFSAPTLEDHFDKTILPKVMQVKNFGRCGRTKYTHLVDQDTTKAESPWFADSANNTKFYNERAGGMRQVFDKPSLYKNKRDI